MIKKILKSNIFKNISYLTIEELISRAISFFTVIYLARILWPENFGRLGYASAFTSFFVLIVNMGFDVYGIREIAKDRSKAKELLSNITLIKLILFLVAYLFLFIVINILEKDNDSKNFVLLYGLTMIVSVFTIDWFCQGFENFKLIALGRVFRNIVYALFVFAFIKYHNQLKEVVIFQILSGLFGNFLLWYFAKDYFSFNNINLYKWKGYLKTGFILASSFFMINIYYNLDKVMIGLWYSKRYVGWYDVAYKIMSVGLIFSGILWSVFSPKISRFDKSLNLYIKAMLFLGVILLIILLLGSNFIIGILFGDNYKEAVFPLKILALNLFLVFVNVAFISPIMLWNEKKYFLIVSSGGIANVIFNFLLIPKYNIIGASIATVLSEMMVFIFGIRTFLKIYKKECMS